jgi:hypothetical protein
LEQMKQSNTSIPMVTFCILPPLFPSWQLTPLLLLLELTDPFIAIKATLGATDSSTPAPQRSVYSELVTLIPLLHNCEAKLIKHNYSYLKTEL